MEETKRGFCPFLGMSYNKDTRRSYIEDMHRCYKTGKPVRVEPKCQALYCLGNDYEHCDRWKSVETPEKISPRTKPLMPALFAIAGIILAFFLGRAFFSQGIEMSHTTQYSQERASSTQEQAGFLRNPTAIAVTNNSSTPAATKATPGSTGNLVPKTNATSVTGVGTPSTTPSQSRAVYQVSRGDTLYSIAIRYGLTVDALKRANNLTTENINVGQMILIP